MREPIRIFAALGPGDIVKASRSRAANQCTEGTSIAFSEQLFAYCNSRKIKTLAISSNNRIDQFLNGVVYVENRPKPLHGGSGLRFHFSLLLYGLYLAIRARQFSAHLAIIDSGTTHYFALTLFRLFRIPVFVNLHNVLWPCGYPPSAVVHRGIRLLNALFFRFVASGAIGVSPECERQVIGESSGKIRFFQYRCQFFPDGFRKSVPYRNGPFRVIYVGRAEQNKGVLDIIKIAKEIRSRSSVTIIFNICGDGGALDQLKEAVQQSQLSDVIKIHGNLKRTQLLELYATSHATIVPTRSDFAEGMPQVCAESMLSDLPVITSEVANAFDVIGPATIRAKTDDIESYIQSILLLVQNPLLYAKLRSECLPMSLQFLDRAKSFPAAVDQLLNSIFDYPKLDDYEKLFTEY